MLKWDYNLGGIIMSYFDDDEQKLKDQAREKGIGYTKNITGGYDLNKV